MTQNHSITGVRTHVGSCLAPAVMMVSTHDPTSVTSIQKEMSARPLCCPSEIRAVSTLSAFFPSMCQSSSSAPHASTDVRPVASSMMIPARTLAYAKRVCQNRHILFFCLPIVSQDGSDDLGCCFSFSHHL